MVWRRGLSKVRIIKPTCLIDRVKRFKGEQKMETWYYEVVSIDGDYANLKRTDIESPDLKLVARALLPAEIYEGCKLKYELMQYSIEA